MGKTLTIAPFNRVEGDLKIKVEIEKRSIDRCNGKRRHVWGFEKDTEGPLS